MKRGAPLSEEQVKAIHQASLEVLERTGYHVPVPEVRELLSDAGARVVGERAYLPPELVEAALKDVRAVTLYNRHGEPALPLERGRVVFGALADTPHMLDPYQRRVRPYRKEDQPRFATLLDALPNIDYIQCLGQSQDVPADLQTQVAVAQTVRHSTKPLLIYPYDRQGLLDVLEMAAVIAGGEQAFRQKPFLMCSSVPAAPLYGTDYNLELLMTAAEREVPTLYYSCPAIGGNSPSSLAGTLVLANADWLAGLLMHQTKRPGAPFCTAGFTVQLMDMKTTLWSYCAPETQLAYAAVADLAHWYGLPAWGLEAISDTPLLDTQAGAEMAANCTWAMQSGFEVVHNAGLMGAGKLIAAEGAVWVDEVIAYTRAAAGPAPVSASALSEGVALIGEMGPMGEYVSHEHTLAHFRDFWYPRLFNRANFDPAGERLGPDLGERLNAEARRLMEEHIPEPLSEDVLAEIEALEASWHQRRRR